MKVSFGISKFKALLAAGSFTVLANYIVRLSDSIIAGNLLGPDALAGVNLVGPVLAAISFLAGLISTGMATNYSLAMGRCDRLRARQFGTQALWSVAIFGGALSLAAFFGRDIFLDFFGASPSVTGYARGYLSWVWPMAVIEGLEMLLVSLGYADGDAKICSLGYTVNFIGNFVISIVAVKCGMGTSGCALGSIISGLLAIAILSCHFFRKSNTFMPVRHFSIADTWRIIQASFGDAAAFLCDGLLFLFVNKFVIMNFGSSLLPVVGVATALWGFLEFFNGVGVAIQPIVTVYYGERNMKSVRTVMGSAMRVAVVEGLLFMTFFGLFPKTVVVMVGITDPALVGEAVFAIRCMCWGFIALAFAGLFNSYYMFVEKPALAGAVTILCYLIMPIACVAACALVGHSGVWVGMGLGPFAGVVMTAFIIVSTAGVKAFPLLLPRDRDAKTHVFSLHLTDEEIVKVSKRVSELPGVPIRAALMVEEVFMVVKDRGHGRKLLGEVTVDTNDGVQLTLRDDGEIFDITDADQQISSLRTFLVASMMCAQGDRMNLITTGFNRNVFKFQ